MTPETTEKIKTFVEKLYKAERDLMIAVEGKRGSKKAALEARKLLTEIRKEIPDVKRATMEA